MKQEQKSSPEAIATYLNGLGACLIDDNILTKYPGMGKYRDASERTLASRAAIWYLYYLFHLEKSGSVYGLKEVEDAIKFDFYSIFEASSGTAVFYNDIDTEKVVYLKQVTGSLHMANAYVIAEWLLHYLIPDDKSKNLDLLRLLADRLIERVMSIPNPPSDPYL